MPKGGTDKIVKIDKSPSPPFSQHWMPGNLDQ